MHFMKRKRQYKVYTFFFYLWHSVGTKFKPHTAVTAFSSTSYFPYYKGMGNNLAETDLAMIDSEVKSLRLDT